MESILNISAPNVYPIGTYSIPWCANCVIAVHLHKRLQLSKELFKIFALDMEKNGFPNEKETKEDSRGSFLPTSLCASADKETGRFSSKFLILPQITC